MLGWACVPCGWFWVGSVVMICSSRVITSFLLNDAKKLANDGAKKKPSFAFLS
jgi:hypothetical protein